MKGILKSSPSPEKKVSDPPTSPSRTAAAAKDRTKRIQFNLKEQDARGKNELEFLSTEVN